MRVGALGSMFAIAFLVGWSIHSSRTHLAVDPAVPLEQMVPSPKPQLDANGPRPKSPGPVPAGLQWIPRSVEIEPLVVVPKFAPVVTLSPMRLPDPIVFQPIPKYEMPAFPLPNPIISPPAPITLPPMDFRGVASGNRLPTAAKAMLAEKQRELSDLQERQPTAGGNASVSSDDEVERERIAVLKRLLDEKKRELEQLENEARTKGVLR
jgi:hypothetical protein